MDIEGEHGEAMEEWFCMSHLFYFKFNIYHLAMTGNVSGNYADFAANLASTILPSIFFNWGIFFKV